MFLRSRLLPYAFFIVLGFAFNNWSQGDCKVDRPIVVSELQGRLLLEINKEVFSVTNAEVSISEKGKEAFFGIADVKPDADGYFTIKGLKPGKYYLSVDSLVGHMSLFEFEVVGNDSNRIIENQREFVFFGSEPRCGIRTVKSFDKNAVKNKTAISAWGKITEISLERTGCFGSCPIYKITLRSDGSATYVGKRYSPREGAFQGKFEYGFEKLAELLYRQGFFNLENEYNAPFTDLDTTIVTVTQDGKAKAVRDYGSAAPVELWGVEQLIDSLSEKIVWKKEK